MYYRLGHWMHDRRWWVVALWLSLAGLLHWVAPTWSSVTMDGDLEQLPATTTTARATKLRERAFPADRAASQIVLVMARVENGLTLEDRQYAIRLAQRVEESIDLPLVDVWTEKTPVVGPQLKSRSGHAQRIVLRLTNGFMATDNIRVLAAIRQLIDRQAAEKPPGLQVGITGSAAIGGDMLTAAAESVRNTHRATLALVVLALLAIYRSPRLAIIPLLAISLAASISFDLLTLAAWWSQSFPEIWLQVRIFTTTKIFIVVILFGAGTDYCLFFIARYRELLQARLAAREAIAQALGNVGTALAASAMTTVVGLAMMGWAQFGKFAYSGPAIAICLLVTLAVCITLVPALLATALGNLPGKKPVQNGMDPSNTGPQPSIPWQAWWSALADVILRRPGKVLLLCLIFILPLAWLGWDVPVTYDLLGDLPAQRVSRQGAALMVAHFPPGEIGPLVVLAQLPEGGLHTVEGQLKIAQLVKPLDDLAGIERVRSLYQPTGDPPGTVRLFSSAGLQVLASKGSPLTQAAFVSSEPPLNGIVTRLYLILTDEPFSPAAVMTCQKVEQTLRKLGEDTNSPWYGATFELLGPTAGIRDLEMVTLADRKKIQWLVAIAVWLVLLALLRRPLLSCYLIGTVLLSYLVTLGITNAFFGWIVGSNYVGLDWKVPLFLFVILTAVGQDYNIYLVTRILEEQRRHGLREGLRRAMIHTGGIITSCGVIMAGTFVSMTTGSLLGIVELGFALSLGILLDTFFIRSILVPSLIALTAHD